MYVSRSDERRSDVMDAVDFRFFVRAPDLCPFRHTGVRGAPYRIVAVEPPGIQKHKARRVKLSCLRKEGDRASEHGAVAGLVEELKRGNAGVIPVLTDHIRGAMPLCGTAQTVLRYQLCFFFRTTAADAAVMQTITAGRRTSDVGGVGLFSS